jgi:hypothetical protein
MEQDLSRDPVTGFHKSDPRHKDAHQNDNYVRHSDPAETSRDFSRPQTIPVDEYEAVTGLPHPSRTADELQAQADARTQAQIDEDLQRNRT